MSHRQSLLKVKKQIEAEAEQGIWRGGFSIDEEEEMNNNTAAQEETKHTIMDSSGAKTLLFFGCRWEDHDFLFQKELKHFVANKTLTALHTAFSRPQSPTEKRYVQHDMQTNGKELVHMILNNNTSVYLCGDGNAMGKDVQDCLATLI